MFQRTNSRLILEVDLPNPNPKIATPFKNMAVLTWLDNDGSTHITYGCRRSFAQFDNRQALFFYVSRTFNNPNPKHKKHRKNTSSIEKIEREIAKLKEELEAQKARARKAERTLADYQKKFRALLES